MNSLYEKYKCLRIKGELIALEHQEEIVPFFCYPTNAIPIGFENCIMYCLIAGYDDMVFAANPESCVDRYVYPLAANFADFIGLILACSSANPVEQIIWMDREQFEDYLLETEKTKTEQQKALLSLLERELSLTPIENPFDYVKAIQADFDGSSIKYSDEYYDALGIERT